MYHLFRIWTGPSCVANFAHACERERLLVAIRGTQHVYILERGDTVERAHSYVLARAPRFKPDDEVHWATLTEESVAALRGAKTE